ncbi:peritrophin-55 [Zeugodacus cucurbitae]|uniref:Peritrophin-55 n=1 Tax=Zeugodacus cucurbitae TaxID=28588 RepID=A0A0A1WI19_ZEUCU|nr:peritrophin-55 [Zeugodacus cucurbitae]
MKTTFGVLCAILAVHYVAAQCNLRTYTTQLKPACDLNDIYIKWPNYANLSTYYTCFGVGNPVLTPCPSGEYFTYVYQQCNYCNQYIPAPPCENLKTQNPPNCVPIGSGGSNGSATTASSLPTPYYPTTVVTKPPATKRPPVTKAPPATKAPVTRPPKNPPTGQPPSVGPTPPSGVPTPPGPPGTPIPGPPSPVTNVPGVPQPPTPEPTPPSINITPPIA